MIDFYRPDGTPVPVVRGDPRQLNDATFNAGTNSGSEYEYMDNFNRLHFYVLAKHRDANGVLSYDVGVRRLDGAGPFTRGVALGESDKTARRPGFLASCTFPLTNTGQAGTGVFDSDIYRLAASSRARTGRSRCRTRSPRRRPARRRRCRCTCCATRSRTTATRERRDADGDVGGGRDQDGDPHVQRARPRHDSRRLGVTRTVRGRLPPCTRRLSWR